MADSAKDLIAKLVASGLTKAEISRRVGRNSSLITQIERGKKPGSNLVEPLAAILEKRPVPKPVARVTRSGAPAKVRKGKAAAKPAIRRDSSGRIKIAPPTALDYVALRRLERIAGDGGKVSIRVVDAKGNESVLYSRGGQYASVSLRDFHNSGLATFKEYVAELLEMVAPSSPTGKEADTSLPSELSVGFIAVYTAAEARL